MYRPYKRINININLRKIINLLGMEVIIISGIKSIISVSKIKKIILIRKNWILNGNRLCDKGSNPHSKGDIFS